MLSREREMNINKNPSCGGRNLERLSNILQKSMHNINEYLKKMREEMESPKKLESRARSRLAHDRCEHAATPYYVQWSQMPISTMKEMNKRKFQGGKLLVIFCKSMSLKMKILEIILLSKSFARSRWRGASCMTWIDFLYLPLMDPQIVQPKLGWRSCILICSSTKFLKMKPSELQCCTLKVRPMLGGCLSHFHCERSILLIFQSSLRDW